MTIRELERLLDLLEKLSTELSAGPRRDEIASIRSECWRLLEDKGATGW